MPQYLLDARSIIVCLKLVKHNTHTHTNRSRMNVYALASNKIDYSEVMLLIENFLRLLTRVKRVRTTTSGVCDTRVRQHHQHQLCYNLRVQAIFGVGTQVHQTKFTNSVFQTNLPISMQQHTCVNVSLAWNAYRFGESVGFICNVQEHIMCV